MLLLIVVGRERLQFFLPGSGYIAYTSLRGNGLPETECKVRAGETFTTGFESIWSYLWLKQR
jgi:hypothetical protein